MRAQFTILVLLVAATACTPEPKSFEECVLKNVKPNLTNAAVGVVTKACRSMFPDVEVAEDVDVSQASADAASYAADVAEARDKESAPDYSALRDAKPGSIVYECMLEGKKSVFLLKPDRGASACRAYKFVRKGSSRVYAYTDANGVRNYSNRPPPEGMDSTVRNIEYPILETVGGSEDN
ncbi:DUF4124 domain-containing protein [Lysobacter sp. M2-1]|uniref:DUF4124 domain-containing protein n=1 Tax=Lysobacter sp. M2-1 TaxID=2916839 RepID=UPI001F58F5D3|nr:DUF4124 domain-containing protein [Lysobacter sp. M2-1]